MTIKQQNSVIFEPVKLPADYKFNLTGNLKEIYVDAEKAVKLNGFISKNPSSKGLIIYFQGNAKNLQNWLDHHSMALDWGYDVLVTDYRGFGKSAGSMAGEKLMFSDADKIYDYAIKNGYKPDQIILYGYSMGSAMASYLAANKKAKALVLESPYSSIAEIAWVQSQAPSYKLDNKEIAKNIDIPTLIVHGDQDQVITFDHSQRIYANLKTPRKQIIILKGGGHGDLRMRPEYKKLITDFLNNS